MLLFVILKSVFFISSSGRSWLGSRVNWTHVDLESQAWSYKELSAVPTLSPWLSLYWMISPWLPYSGWGKTTPHTTHVHAPNMMLLSLQSWSLQNVSDGKGEGQLPPVAYSMIGYCVRMIDQSNAVPLTPPTPSLQVTLPVYLNSTRSELLFTLDFQAEDMTPSGGHHYYERGVALLCSTLWTIYE